MSLSVYLSLSLCLSALSALCVSVSPLSVSLSVCLSLSLCALYISLLYYILTARCVWQFSDGNTDVDVTKGSLTVPSGQKKTREKIKGEFCESEKTVGPDRLETVFEVSTGNKVDKSGPANQYAATRINYSLCAAFRLGWPSLSGSLSLLVSLSLSLSLSPTPTPPPPPQSSPGSMDRLFHLPL